MQECDKIRERGIGYLKDKSVLDLGCGSKKVVPWAVGVDDGSEWSSAAFKQSDPDVVWSVAPGGGLQKALSSTYPMEYDVVFSSHTLEHVQAPILETLRYWWTFVKRGGLFIAYLPEEKLYRFDPCDLRIRNPAHHHYLTMETFRWYLNQIHDHVTVAFEERAGSDEYSFLVIARKI